MEENESQEARIEKLEVQKEDTEKEINFIVQTIQQVNSMEIDMPNCEAKDEIHLFKQKLAKSQENNEQILLELNESIEQIRGY